MSRDERPLEAGLTDAGVPPALEAGAMEVLGLLPNSSNYTFLARLTIPGDDPVMAVYKPRRGEIPLWDFPEGTLCRREVAAYVVARALGWPNVPPTVLRDGPEGFGSAQLFVAFDPGEHFFTLERTHSETFRDVALFDAIVNNADRKAGHCLLGRDGRVFVIDHGTCFNEEPKLRTVIWGFAGQAIAPRRLGDLHRFEASLQDGPLASSLSGLLDAREQAALRGRVRHLLKAGAYPQPMGDRPYPWPPV